VGGCVAFRGWNGILRRIGSGGAIGRFGQVEPRGSLRVSRPARSTSLPLLLRSSGSDVERYAQALETLDKFALADASLHRDVLQACAGLLRNYDPLVRDAQRMDDTLAWLRAYTQAEGIVGGRVERLAATVAQEKELTERFKSNNALRQNSLSYVGFLGTDPALVGQDAHLAQAVSAVAAAVLLLTRDTSAESFRALQTQIDRLATQAHSVGPDAEGVQTLLAHARLLRIVLPEVDKTLLALSVPAGEPLDAVRAAFARRQAGLEATSQRFRLLLYFVSLLLLATLVRLGLRLRARALALHRRAAFEHLIAECSTRLINCPPTETEAHVTQVLGDIGRLIGVDRVYVVLEGNPIRTYAWCADGAAYPAGWPDHALELSMRLDAAGIVAVRDTADLPPGEIRDRLLAAGVRGWGRVPLNRPGRVRGIMGFDAPACLEGVFPAAGGAAGR
jgi:hypothetical protein